MFKKGYLIGFFLLLSSIIIFSGCGSSTTSNQSQSNNENSGNQQANIQIASSSSGGSLYAIGSAWAQIINSSTNIHATAVATGGGTENLRLLGTGESQMGLQLDLRL